jgi:hypothetical protein
MLLICTTQEVESAEDDTLRGKDDRIPVGVGDVEQGAAAAAHAVSGSAAASAANAASTMSRAEGHSFVTVIVILIVGDEICRNTARTSVCMYVDSRA